MLTALLRVLFAEDHRFVSLRTRGLSPDLRERLARFWNDPAFAQIPSREALAPADFRGLVDGLEALAAGRSKAGGSLDWRAVTQASERVAEDDPVAGALIALQAMAAWTGALGDDLFAQPWSGHDEGWHVFPLIVARNLVAAEAIWAGRCVCKLASEFVEASKYGPHSPTLKSVIGAYEAVARRADRIFSRAVDDLAWELTAAAAPAAGPNPADAGPDPGSFRAEVAALFWTSGDALHADRLRANGPADYRIPYDQVRNLVDDGLRRLERDPLGQAIWLDMKDRGPVSLRSHAVLFGRLNNVFRSHPLHALDGMAPVPISTAYARVCIGWMAGAVEPRWRDHLRGGMVLVGQMLRAQAPEAWLAISGLVLALRQDAGEAGEAVSRDWAHLAEMAAEILRWSDANGAPEAYESRLDVPFLGLDGSPVETRLDRIEAFRSANLRYWLEIAPPPPPAGPPAHIPEALLERERELLRDLRGARFILLLPRLPAHYRRHGVSLTDPPPAGAGKGGRPADPFDPAQARETLRETREQLRGLYEAMRAVAPAYAEARLEPRNSADAFTAALSAHAGG